MKKNRIVYFPFLVILLFGFSSCLVVKPLEFVKVNSLKIGEKAGTKGLVITTNLSLYNPNSFNIAVSSADIDVFAEGVNLGKLKIPENIDITPKSEFSGDFYIEISFSKLLLAGNSVLTKLKSGNIEFHLKGSIEIDTILKHKIIPIDYVERIDLK